MGSLDGGARSRWSWSPGGASGSGKRTLVRRTSPLLRVVSFGLELSGAYVLVCSASWTLCYDSEAVPVATNCPVSMDCGENGQTTLCASAPIERDLEVQ